MSMATLLELKMPIHDALLTAVLGYAVVFLGLAFLLLIIVVMVKIMAKKSPKAENATEVEAEKASGSAGELKLYDTNPRDAAMIMAIVADALGKPLNELRFISIREVKDK